MDPRTKPIPDDFLYIYNNKTSNNQLRKHYKVSQPIINRWIKQADLPDLKQCVRWEERLDVDQLRREIATATCFENIGLYNKNRSIFRKIVKRQNIDVTHLTTINQTLSTKIKKLAANGLGAKQISSELNLPSSKVISICKTYNIKLLPYAGTRIDNNIQDIEQFAADCNVLTHSEIKKKYNITASRTLEDFCKRNNLTSPLQTKENWKLIEQELVNNFEKIVELNQTIPINQIKQRLSLSASISTIYRFLIKRNVVIKLHRYNQSVGELQIKEFINQELGIQCHSTKYKHNNKVYELDCYCPQFNLAVEYCGEYWHSTNRGIPRTYHQDKYKWAKDQGITLITIWENEWINLPDIVKSMIRSRLGMSDKIYAKKCRVEQINSERAKLFHSDNHISGYVNSSINVGLYHKDQLVAVMSFAKSRFDKRFDYEITRMSFQTGINVVGGAGKMFSYFRRLFPTSSVITYSDLRFGDGKVYEKIGFAFNKTTRPNYVYFKKSTMEKFSRMQFQKKKVLQMFPDAVPSDSEQSIMIDNGYLVVYDCGNNKYVID